MTRKELFTSFLGLFTLICLLGLFIFNLGVHIWLETHDPVRAGATFLAGFTFFVIGKEAFGHLVAVEICRTLGWPKPPPPF